MENNGGDAPSSYLLQPPNRMSKDECNKDMPKWRRHRKPSQRERRLACEFDDLEIMEEGYGSGIEYQEVQLDQLVELADDNNKEEAELDQMVKLADDNNKEEAKPAGANKKKKLNRQERYKRRLAREFGDLKIMEEGDGSCIEDQEVQPRVQVSVDQTVKLADDNNKEEAKLDQMVKLADDNNKEEAKLAGANKKKKKKEAKLAHAKKKKEAELARAKKLEEAELAFANMTDAEIIAELDRLEDDRDPYLMQPRLTWEDKVVNILQTVRRREVTEYNRKLEMPAYTRFFCGFNIAFFDLDKESEGMPWEPIDKIPSPRHQWLADSVNIISIKVAESDRDYPISVFGTVLARDEYDYRCVYLFKRGRDDPQVITSKDDTLTLMGPYRALAVMDHMYFEFHLKVKGEGDVDKDFSKGVLVHSAVCHGEKKIMTKPLFSCLSTVELVYTPVPCAVEASFTVSTLKGPSDFISKVTAWTTGNEENKIVVYNKKVAGVGCGGSVVHGLVAVPEDEELVLRVCVFEHCEHEQGKCFQLALGLGTKEQIAKQDSYELQVRISWRGVMNCGRPNMWGRVGETRVLL